MLKKICWILISGFIVALLTVPVLAQTQETGPAPAGVSPAPHQPDPSGLTTGNASDVPAAKVGEPTMAELINAVGHNRVAINMMYDVDTDCRVSRYVHATRICYG